MNYKASHLPAIGMMILLTPLALAGCLAQESDELASDEATSEAQLGSIRPRLTCASPNIHELIQPYTCQSGWPGARNCKHDWISATNVVSVVALISGNNGEISHSVSGVGTQQVELLATVHEGDAFNPGRNTTTYNVEWCRQPM